MSDRRSVVQKIQTEIASGAIAPGRRLPSERKLAAEMGVSRASIQGALRELESLGLVLRRPNCRPLVLPTRARPASFGIQAADQIAIWILPDMQDLGGAMMLQGIRSVFGAGNYRLLIGCPPSHEHEVVQRAEIDFLNSLVENPNIAGVIVWDTCNPGCHQAYEALVRSQVPLVFIDREPARPIAADLVATNNRKAARSAVRYLTDLGHSRIAMVLGPDRASSVQDRIGGYQSALRDAGIEPDSQLIISLAGHDAPGGMVSAERALIGLLNSPCPPTAFFGVNDRIALLLMEAAKGLRIRVPERVSIVGFDWLMRWLPSGGDLTTVAQPFDEIGRTAAQRLLDRIGSKSGETPRQVLLDAEIVVRQSTAAPQSAAVSR